MTIVKEQGTPGTRAAPTQTGKHDENIGSRLDYGEIVKKDGKEFRRYHWRLNKNAKNPTIKQAAQKDSHAVWSYGDVEVKEEKRDDKEADKAADGLFDQIKKNMK